MDRSLIYLYFYYRTDYRYWCLTHSFSRNYKRKVTNFNALTEGLLHQYSQEDIKEQDFVVIFINHKGYHWTLLVSILYNVYSSFHHRLFYINFQTR